MRESAADVVVVGRIDRRESFHHCLFDSHFAALPQGMFPALLLAFQVDAVNGVKEVKRIADLELDGAHRGTCRLDAVHFLEVLNHWRRIESQFLEAEQVVANAIPAVQTIRNAIGTREAMEPTQKRQA